MPLCYRSLPPELMVRPEKKQKEQTGDKKKPASVKRPPIPGIMEMVEKAYATGEPITPVLQLRKKLSVGYTKIDDEITRCCDQRGWERFRVGNKTYIVNPDDQKIFGVATSILAVLRDVAAKGQRCPTNVAIAKQIGCSKTTVSNKIQKLISDGALEVRRTVSGRRRIAIAGTHHVTA